LSHYESFRAYHEAFYRYVEPTSVTPFTHQARIRALHAALVIVMRHGNVGLRGNELASVFSLQDARVKNAVECLRRRCHLSMSEGKDMFDASLDELVEQWTSEIDNCVESKRSLVYVAHDRSVDALLYSYDEERSGLWPTLQSMRNVEHSAIAKVF
jgi:hypothetical protein